ncbi:MAG: DUF2752 domain-containing protein [Deltaproteobacteria bacterium]|nr:DUF2752 domain-containing protein [Deltaproteobacteria bacterium]
MQHYLIPRKVALAFTAIFLFLMVVNMTGAAQVEKMARAIPVFCPFKVITGVACPGCGMTRAMLSLIDGRPGEAFLYNPFCFFLLFVLMLSLMPRRWITRLELDARVLPVLYSAVLFLVLVFWFFDRLLPHIS